ncbi:MAG: inositol monophosphatase family protein [Gemmatimonadota bacterium]
MTTSQAAVPYTGEIIAKILDAMIVAARAAEGIISAGATRRGDLVWQSKGLADYLTEIDTSSEALIRHEITNALHADFPDLRVLGEESWRDEPLPHGLAFVVDPLDGTTNFLHGIPAYSVSIAAIHDTEPIVALVLDIPHGELYTAVRGMGARLNGIPLHVSQISDPERALIGTGFPFGENADAVRYARQFVPIARTTSGIRRAGSAAIDLAWVAGGRFDAFWELHLSPWDMAAGILLVREAGGIVTGIDGTPATIETAPLVAGNPAMHGWLLDVLHGADRSGT